MYEGEEEGFRQSRVEECLDRCTSRSSGQPMGCPLILPSRCPRSWLFGRACCGSGLAHPHRVHPLSPGNPSIQKIRGLTRFLRKDGGRFWGLRPREPVSRQNTPRRQAPPRRPWPPDRCCLYNSGEDFVGPRGARSVADALSLGRAAWKARSMERTRMSRPSTGYGLIGRVPGRTTCHSTYMLSGPFQSRHVRSHPCDVRCGPARTNSESLTWLTLTTTSDDSSVMNFTNKTKRSKIMWSKVDYIRSYVEIPGIRQPPTPPFAVIPLPILHSQDSTSASQPPPTKCRTSRLYDSPPSQRARRIQKYRSKGPERRQQAT